MDPVRDVQGEYMKINNYRQLEKSDNSHNKQMCLKSTSCL